MAAQATPQRPAEQQPATSIAARTAGFEKLDGFIPLYLDAKQGKLYAELPRDDTRALFWTMLATGLGSNPVGLDRGASGDEQVVHFTREGDRVLLVFENNAFRTSLDDPAHQRSIAESFPASTVAALPLVATEGGRLLVDLTDLAFRDWNDVAGTLARSNQGSYSVARDRSYVDRAHTSAHPGNTEIDVALTFAASGRPGSIVNRITPDGRAFTLRQHLTLLPLPVGYQPRAMDPRVGYFGVTFKDYGQPIQRALEQRWVSRHRLERVNPSDPNSPFREPIVYYVDRGIPEPIRTALLDGVRWWTEAFDRAGLKGAFRAELLPEGADPMDARYNVVQWENRNERGWSVGGSLGDPRTGEIIKGMARLDSHRARTDYNIYAALMGADASAADTAFVLARVRQVGAHEVGHTLGLAHNYIASINERASVMDYPAPRARVTADGKIDLSQAYGVGPGDYDVWAIRWGYGIFPAGTERDSLAAIVNEGLKKGYLYLSDADARPEYASDPRTSLWDDAATPMEFLQRQVAVRRVALDRFGLRNIAVGEPIATLEERLAPLYFFHRFAVNGVTKTIGGMEYANAVRGDNQTETKPVSGARQRAALSALLAELQPSELAIPDTVLSLLGPRPSGYSGAVNNSNSPVDELFRGRTDPAFDELSAARTLAQMIVDGILQRERSARVVAFATRGPNMPTLGEVIDSLVARTWNQRDATPKAAALRRVAQRAVADRLLGLAADTAAAPEVRAVAEYEIGRLRPDAARRAQAGDTMSRAHWAAIAGDFQRWIERRELPAPTPALVAPPGDPFGMEP
ncbi:MAG TPA: zinc-dependent metalloprotease [Gemmatimonadaceae bacterium]|nr:zinc-dependent metalloprotease [Gemmatimonadaceae bacterium]